MNEHPGRDHQAAEAEDQATPERGSMGSMGKTDRGKAPVEGAFADQTRDDHGRDTSTSESGDSLSEGPMVFENVGEMHRH